MIAKPPVRSPRRLAAMAAVALLLAGCAPPAAETDEPAAEETPVEVESRIPAEFRALGTEPFWAVTRGTGGLRYSTPDNSEGTLVEVAEEESETELRRISGTLAGETFSIELTIGACSDGMSDRSYPFVARVTLGEARLQGCARPIEG